MFARLRNELSHLRMQYVASCDKDKCFGESLEISRVLTEHRISPEGHCDIAILCSDQDTSAPNIGGNRAVLASKSSCWQALEYHNWNEPRGPQKDVEKLQRYWKRRDENRHPFTGIAMLFRHPGAFACHEVGEIAGTDHEAAFPENGVAIHVVANEGNRCENGSRFKAYGCHCTNHGLERGDDASELSIQFRRQTDCL